MCVPVLDLCNRPQPWGCSKLTAHVTTTKLGTETNFVHKVTD